MRLLLGSGGFSTPERRERFTQALDDFLGGVRKVLFVPFALADYDGYVEKMSAAKFDAGRELTGIHRSHDMKAAVAEAEAIYVGGGNTFRLLNDLHGNGLLGPIRDRIRSGVPYIGVSAGTNVACPTMKTTNDMPIVHPPSLDALGLLEWQINPHFVDGTIHFEMGGKLIPYGGETRADHLREFHEVNDLPVLGLREGATLRIEGPQMRLIGPEGGCVFRKGAKPVEVSEGDFTELPAPK